MTAQQPGRAHGEQGAGIAPAALWFGLLGGILAWVVGFTVSYPLGSTCGGAAATALPIVVAMTALVTLAAAFTAFRNWRAVTARDEEAGGEAAGRERFFSFGGLLLSGVAVLLTGAHSLPLLIVGACA
jgi:hypothetical protein